MTSTSAAVPARPDARGIGPWFRRHPKTCFLIALLLVISIVVFAIHASAERALLRSIAAVAAKGEPTTWAELQARLPVVPDDENMTPRLIACGEAIRKLTIDEAQGKDLPIIGQSLLPATGSRLNGAQLASAKWYLDQTASELKQAHAAIRLGKGLFKLVRPTARDVYAFARVEGLRATVKSLCLEVLVCAETGDATRTAERLLDLTAFPKAFDGGDDLLCSMVMSASQALSADMIERSINLVALPEPTLKELQLRLKSGDLKARFRRCIEGERVLFLERMLVIGKGGAQLDSEQFNPADLVRCVPALMQLDTNAGLAFYTECLDVLARPDPVAIITEMDQVPNPPRYCILSNMLLPSFSRYFALHLSYVGRMRALELAIAAERYRLANGDWPAAAADLVPRFIEALPIDPGDGKPIRYARFENGIKTWTLLTVDDRKDDGGDVGRLDPIPSKRRPPDTGWVILNPDQRNRSSTSQPEK